MHLRRPWPSLLHCDASHRKQCTWSPADQAPGLPCNPTSTMHCLSADMCGSGAPEVAAGQGADQISGLCSSHQYQAVLAHLKRLLVRLLALRYPDYQNTVRRTLRLALAR